MIFREWLQPRLKDAVQKNGVGTVAEITGVSESTVKRSLGGMETSTDNAMKFLKAFSTTYEEMIEIVQSCFPHIAAVFSTMSHYQKEWNGTPEGLNEEIRRSKTRYKINCYACLGEGLPLKRGFVTGKWGSYGNDELDSLIQKGYLVEGPDTGNVTSTSLKHGKREVSTSCWKTIRAKICYDLEDMDVEWCEKNLVGAITHRTGLTSSWGMKKLREAAIRYTAEVGELQKDSRFDGNIAYTFNIHCGLLDKVEQSKVNLDNDLDGGE